MGWGLWNLFGPLGLEEEAVGSSRDDTLVQNDDKKVDDDESTVGVVGAEAEG